jgi:hypothetical protein
MASIFVSYAREDVELAHRIAKAIQTENVHVFLDTKGISAAEPIDDRIAHAIKGCSALLVVLSPAASTSMWVPFEVGYAMALGRRVIPYREHSGIEMPLYLARIKAVESIAELRAFLSTDWKIRNDLSRPSTAYGKEAISPDVRDALTRSWNGRGTSFDVQPDVPMVFDAKLRFEYRDGELIGDAEISIEHEGKLVTFQMVFSSARVVHERLLWFDYQANDGGEAFGTAVFDLEGCRFGVLRGRYLGRGAWAGRPLVTGNLQFKPSPNS